MIEVKNLTKTYHNKSSKVVALSKLNFKLGDKGMVFLYGASGEGKSTVLNILCGLDKYDKGGKVLYNGKDIMSMEQAERDAYRAHVCGLVFEKDNLISSLTVAENVKLARELNRQPVTDEEVRDVLKVVKLSGFEKRHLHELSSGELQRVAVARVLLCRPKILFVDEPTGHLDRNNSDIFWKTVKKLSTECLVVAITHKRKIVEDYADRVIELGNGSIISDTYINEELKKADEELFSSKVEKTTIETKYPSPKFKTKLKLGLNVLKVNKFRFVSMLALIVLTLIAFATTYLLATYNPYLAMARSATMQDIDYATFEKVNGEEISNVDISNIYSRGLGNIYYRVYDSKNSIKLGASSEYTLDIGGFMVVNKTNDSSKNVLGQNILFGEYPSELDSGRKIVISDYVAGLMSYKGLNYRESINPESFGFFKDKNIGHLIGKDILIGKDYYKIQAIYDTDYEKYINTNVYELLDKDSLELFNYNLNNIYSMIHTNAACINNIIKSETEVNYVDSSIGLVGSVQKNYVISARNIASASNFNIVNKTAISKNEVLLPIYLFNDIFGANLDSISYLNDNNIISALNNKSTTKLSITSSRGATTEYTVVGVVDSDYLIFADNDYVDSDGKFAEFVQKNSYPVIKMASLYSDENDLRITIENFESIDLEYRSLYSEEIEQVSEYMEILKIAFVVATIFIAIFSMYFMFTFFATVIAHNRRAIGTYRSLGARTITIFSIFMITCGVLTILALVSSMILSFVSTIILNSALMSAFALPISILNVNGLMYLYIGLIGVVMTVVGSIVPIIIYCSKSPVEVLKGK